ncbi:carboxymuconolactone decarboxylase family protein [Occultella gossypii]|uniref:Carboxymuconolactone decarboxylase family protein n=1 Tax=Occultella gossypii TaxID=2800820 RepID=A0ABS7SB19_9MICO|nr:carboxymuconolactone decarboxylase family protein [Occultella gossypii]MBZ2197083.1 carboxymuconolactone decarboxylase family protein [Occultella gossypii]
MSYTDRLRRFALNDAKLEAELAVQPTTLESREVALVRLAALIAVGGAEPSYGTEVDDAVSAGVTTAEIVDILATVTPIVGLPLAVAAASKVALALGLDPLDMDGMDPA